MAVFTYSRVPAFNPNTTPVSVARSASGNVYDIGDTEFNTPLNLTLVATNAVTTTLISDSSGMFPDFTLLNRTQCVFKSGSAKMVLTTTTPIPGPTGPPSTVPGPPGPQTTDASLLTAGTLDDARLPARLSDGQLSATYGPATFVRDIRSYLLPGESLDRTGTTSVSAIFQRAVDALTVEYAAQDSAFGVHGYQIYTPIGRYRLDTKIDVKTGVGIAGESRQGTVFLPYGRTTAFDAPTIVTDGAWIPTDTIDDSVWSDFTLDCSHQWHTEYDANVKGFKIQNARRMRIERVTALNAWATQIGNDRLFDSTYVDCVSIGAGRGKAIYGGDQYATGAGFGMATGFEADESLTIVNCLAKDNYSHGFFTELSNSTILTPVMSKGTILNGCVAIGNTTGLQDSGTMGLQVNGGNYSNNEVAGISIRGTSASSNRPGLDGTISGALISGNRHGITLWQVPNSGYTVNGCTIIENVMNGIYITDEKCSHFTATNNLIARNGASGVRVAATTDRLKIAHNTIRDNGQNVAETYRDGITVTQGSTYMSIIGNIVTDTQVTKTQQNGVALLGSSVVAGHPRMVENDLQGNFAASFNITQTLASELKERNWEGAAIPSGTVTMSDAFTRADGVLGTTAVGAKAWVTEGAAGYSGVVASNKAKLTGGTTSLGYAVADSGLSDAVVTVTASGMDSTRQAGVLLRYVDLNNYVSLLYRVTSTDLHYRLSRRVAGVSTDILALTTLSTPGDVIEVTMNGTSYSIKINGVAAGTATSSYHVSATKQGFAITNPAAQTDTIWDDISVKTL